MCPYPTASELLAVGPTISSPHAGRGGPPLRHAARSEASTCARARARACVRACLASWRARAPHCGPCKRSLPQADACSALCGVVPLPNRVPANPTCNCAGTLHLALALRARSRSSSSCSTLRSSPSPTRSRSLSPRSSPSPTRSRSLFRSTEGSASARVSPVSAQMWQGRAAIHGAFAGVHSVAAAHCSNAPCL